MWNGCFSNVKRCWPWASRNSLRLRRLKALPSTSKTTAPVAASLILKSSPCAISLARAVRIDSWDVKAYSPAQLLLANPKCDRCTMLAEVGEDAYSMGSGCESHCESTETAAGGSACLNRGQPPSPIHSLSPWIRSSTPQQEAPMIALPVMAAVHP